MELLTVQEKQEFLDAVAMRFCPQCGTAIVQLSRGRRKKFCSDECRWQWKSKHEKPERWKNSRIATCPICGKEFIASREYARSRKCCSRACANRGRAIEKRKAMEAIVQENELQNETSEQNTYSAALRH